MPFWQLPGNREGRRDILVSGRGVQLSHGVMHVTWAC